MKIVYALHGFLGLPTDWKSTLPGVNPVDVVQVGHPTETGLWEWAECFNDLAAKGSHRRVLIGYSLGGRLALHALLHNPALWSAAILISAHPGLKSAEECSDRVQKDRSWAERFEKESWGSLMQAWNAQELFAGHKFEREESHFSRHVLAETLRCWSLGKQENLINRLQGLELPILWIAGENDVRYSALAHSLSLNHPQSQIWVAPDVGHRVPWTSKSFQQIVSNFIEGKV